LASKPFKTLEIATRRQWRTWLDKHHDSQVEIWLVFSKQHTGQKGIEYTDALEEALCFGWVDSLVKRLDDERFARKFTPRKADSRWSTAIANFTRIFSLADSSRRQASSDPLPTKAATPRVPTRRLSPLSLKGPSKPTPALGLSLRNLRRPTVANASLGSIRPSAKRPSRNDLGRSWNSWLPAKNLG